MALLDEARALLGPPRRRPDADDEPRAYGHIVVDEAQDLSPMQLRMLARRSLSGSMTVVGDIAQGTSGWAPPSWDQVVRHLPHVGAGVRSSSPSTTGPRPRSWRSPAGSSKPPPRGWSPPRRSAPAGNPPACSTRATSGLSGGAAASGVGLIPLVVRTVGEELVAVTGVAGDEGIVGVIVPPSLVDAVADGLLAAGLPAGRVGSGALEAVVERAGGR